MATRALQDWARQQCSGYRDVDVKNMTSSFRDGLAFCAIIHRHRPDLLDFDSLSKENVFENNRLAFEVAETELGIPALLDPDDMVAMRVPDRLSILTYVSQIYHCFNSQSQAGVPHSMKRSAKASPCEPSIKKPVVDTDEKDSPLEGTDRVRRATLSSTCALCSRHVHLVQRYLVEGKLYHRNCFRCKECCNTLLPGAYKPGSQTGTFVCTHHHHKLTGSSQRPGFHRDGDSPAGSDETPGSREGGSTEGSPRLGGRADHRQHERGLPTPRPDAEGVKRGLSVKMLSSVFSGGGGRPPEGRTRSPLEPRGSPESGKAPGESAGQEERPAPAEPSKTPSSETDPRSSPPSGGREEASPEAGDCVQSTAAGEEKAGGSPGQSEASEQTSPSAEEAEVRVKPLPVPRKTVDMATSPSPTPRPTPRPRANLSDSPAQRGENGALVNGGPADQTPPVPKPRDRPLAVTERNEPGKHKDPPWMSLVNAELKRRLAPPPPGAPVPEPKPKDAESAQHSLNPFEEEEEEEEEEKTKMSESSPKPSHPWYGIHAASSPKTRKRPAPRAPSSSPSGRARSPALSSSPSPSPSLSMENISLHSGRSSPELPRRTGGESAESGPSAAEIPTIETPPRPTDGPSPGKTSPTPASQSLALARSTPTPGKVAPTPASETPKPASGSLTPTKEARVPSPNRPPPKPPTNRSPILSGQPGRRPFVTNLQAKSSCKENPFDRKSGGSGLTPKLKPRRGPKPARPPAPGHGFPLIKRKVHSDQYIPEESIQGQLEQLEQQLDELERCGVALEGRLRGCENADEEDDLLTDWFKLIHEKHILVRRELELVYTFKQQNLEERQADVEYELRCLLNKPEKDWTDEDRARDAELMQELITVIEQRNAIINSLDEDKQREEEEDKMLETMIKNKEFHRDPNSDVKKKTKFKGIKMLKFLSNKPDSKHKAEKEKSS